MIIKNAIVIIRFIYAIKKANVIAFITAWLNTHDIKITEEQLDTLIEAAVFSMNNGDK